MRAHLAFLQYRKNVTSYFVQDRFNDTVRAGILSTFKISMVGAGESLYRGKADYHLCSCQSTFGLAVGKEENKKLCFSKQLIKKLIDNCTSGSQPSPCIEISLHRRCLFKFCEI